jgi:hypothetical protein
VYARLRVTATNWYGSYAVISTSYMLDLI